MYYSPKAHIMPRQPEGFLALVNPLTQGPHARKIGSHLGGLGFAEPWWFRLSCTPACRESDCILEDLCKCDPDTDKKFLPHPIAKEFIT